MRTIQTLMRIRAALPPVSTRRCTEGKRKTPGTSEAFKELTVEESRDQGAPGPSDITPKHKSGKARNQMQRAGLGPMVRPETSKVSCCPTQAPSSLGSRGFSSGKARIA